MIAVGKYRARAVDVAMGMSETNGHPFVAVLFEVTLGEALGERVAFRGYLHEDKSGERTIAALRTAGWRGDAFPAPGSPISAWQGLGRAEAVIVVQHEPDVKDPTRVYPRVAFVNNVQELRIKQPMPVAHVSDLSRRFAGLLERGRSTGAPPAASSQAPAAAYPNGAAHEAHLSGPADANPVDEIPF
jgi:hypothetical protein